MSAHEGKQGRSRGLKIVDQVEIAGRHVASVGGGAVSATLAYLGGEAAYKTMGLIAQANEAGLISAEGGFSTVEAIKAAGLAYATFMTGAWSVRMHRMARAIESGRRTSVKKH